MAKRERPAENPPDPSVPKPGTKKPWPGYPGPMPPGQDWLVNKPKSPYSGKGPKPA